MQGKIINHLLLRLNIFPTSHHHHPTPTNQLTHISSITMSSYITTHNDEGKAIFSPRVPKERHGIDTKNVTIELVYTTHKSIPDLSTEADIDQYLIDRVKGLGSQGGLPAEGLAMGILTWKPNCVAPWHRIMAVDTLYVIEGDMEVELDSGEKVVLHAGDTMAGRGTMHTGKNITPNNGVAKMLGVSIPVVTPIKVAGKELAHEWVERA